jgi:hypothetical protein
MPTRSSSMATSMPSPPGCWAPTPGGRTSRAASIAFAFRRHLGHPWPSGRLSPGASQRILRRRLRVRVRRRVQAAVAPASRRVPSTSAPRTGATTRQPQPQQPATCAIRRLRAPPVPRQRPGARRRAEGPFGLRRSESMRSNAASHCCRRLRAEPDTGDPARPGADRSPSDVRAAIPGDGGRTVRAGDDTAGWPPFRRPALASRHCRDSSWRAGARTRGRACRWRHMSGRLAAAAADGAPRFDQPVAPGGYLWWYVDALSDDGRYGLTHHRLRRQRLLALLSPGPGATGGLRRPRGPSAR